MTGVTIILIRLATFLLFAATMTPLTVLAQGVTVKDAAGREVVVGDSARVVSVGGSITEILYELGADQRIVAVDSTSQFPPRALTEKKNVGYMRALSPEGCSALRRR